MQYTSRAHPDTGAKSLEYVIGHMSAMSNNNYNDDDVFVASSANVDLNSSH